MAVTITPQISFTAIETLNTGVDGAQNPDIVHNGFNLTSTTHNATSTAPVTTTSYQDYVLAGGAKTVDLTTLLGVNDESQDATGLKLQMIIISNPSGNNPITVTEGAANGFPLFGAGNSVVFPAGSTMGFHVPEGLTDVVAADKNIDVSGTGTETFKMGITLG